MRLVFADTPPPGELVLEQQTMKRECDESMIWDLKQHPEKAATNFMTRWPDAVPAIAQHSQPMGENLRGFDQFTVNERLIGRRLGTFDVSFYITPIDFSQFSPAQHAEQTALKILALDEQCRLTIGDQVNDAINDYRSAPAERSSLVVSAGPPPSFEALDSGAPSAPSAIVDERSCVPAPMPAAPGRDCRVPSTGRACTWRQVQTWCSLKASPQSRSLRRWHGHWGAAAVAAAAVTAAVVHGHGWSPT